MPTGRQAARTWPTARPTVPGGHRAAAAAPSVQSTADRMVNAAGAASPRQGRLPLCFTAPAARRDLSPASCVHCSASGPLPVAHTSEAPPRSAWARWRPLLVAAPLPTVGGRCPCPCGTRAPTGVRRMRRHGAARPLIARARPKWAAVVITWMAWHVDIDDVIGAGGRPSVRSSAAARALCVVRRRCPIRPRPRGADHAAPVPPGVPTPSGATANPAPLARALANQRLKRRWCRANRHHGTPTPGAA